MVATAAALAVLVGSGLPRATYRVLLEIKPSRIPNAGLGLFLSSTSGPLEPGTVLTEYGTEYVEAVDVSGTLWEDYAMGVPGRPDLIRVSVPWDGEVPGIVEGPLTPVGHIANDGGAILCGHAHTGVRASECVTAAAEGQGRRGHTEDCGVDDSCRWPEGGGAGGYGCRDMCATLRGVEGLVESYRRDALQRANAGFNTSAHSAKGDHGGMTDREGSEELRTPPHPHQPFNFNMVATRRIAPGDEILHAYGETYWLHRAMSHIREPSVRLALYLYQAKHHPETFVAPHALPHAWMRSVHAGAVHPRMYGGRSLSSDYLDGGHTHPEKCVKGSHSCDGGLSEGCMPTMSDTGRAANEEWCQGFVVGNLGYAAGGGDEHRGFCGELAAMFATVLDGGSCNRGVSEVS